MWTVDKAIKTSLVKTGKYIIYALSAGFSAYQLYKTLKVMDELTKE